MKLIECPRDAMQGLKAFIPTQVKIDYINALLKVGFDTIDFGSFVSPKAIPQLADTAEVLGSLELDNTQSKLLAIVANERGAIDACQYEAINYLGYPFSISETFQLRNTKATIVESVERVKKIQALATDNNKEVVIYISMGFGNPYGDDWNTDIVEHWISELAKFDIKIFALADTVGVAKAADISYLFKHLIPTFPNLEIGAHLHAAAHKWQEKFDAAYTNGCTRFDVAMKGYGGCPMAKDDLVGNMATELVVQHLKTLEIPMGIDLEQFDKSLNQANGVFG